MTGSGLRIGLVADTPIKRQYLALMVREVGHRPALTLALEGAGLKGAGLDSPEMAGAAAVPEAAVDAWVVDVALPQDEEPPALLSQLLEHASEPMILCDSSEYTPGSEPHTAWIKRTQAKLRQLGGDINLQHRPRARDLWVLAASTGGPTAVQAFLAELPPGLGVAFVYVQHIDASYTGTLVKMMSQGAYPARVAKNGDVLQADQLSIVTASERVDILDNGTLAVTGEPWSGPYAPSVDQLGANAARVYGSRLGLIVFTGMGDDGAAAGRMVHRRGGQLWVQSLESCTSASMPDAALATGCVSLSASPSELAGHLVAHYRGSPLNQIEEAGSHESPTA